MCQIPALATAYPFQVFLARTQTFEDAVKELDKQTTDRSIDDTLRSYNILFPSEMAFRLPEKADQEIAALLEFLTNCEQKMGQILETTTSLDSNINQHATHLSKLNNLMHALDTVEKGYPARPEPPRLDVLVNFHQWLEGVKQIAPAYNQHLLQTFKYELQDIEAFIEVLKARQDLSKEQKKASEKARKWRLTETLVNTDKLEKQKEQELKRDEQLTNELESVSKLILSEGVKKFWIEKTTAFRKAVALFAKAQMLVTQQFATTWDSLYEEATDKEQKDSK